MADMKLQGLRIGQLARQTGATPKALRLYEQMGLLPTPQRSGSYRVYEREHVEAVMLIRQAQTLGFKLQELRALAATGTLVEAAGLGQVLQAVRSKRKDIDAQIAALQARAALLDACALSLQGAQQAASECPELAARAVK